MFLLFLALLCPALADVEEPTGAAAHQLPRSDGLYVRWDPATSWGSAVLVGTLVDVSTRLAWLLPHAEPLVIGDISRRGGGHLFGHKTHDRGHDVDIGLYLVGGRQPYEGFTDLRPQHLDLEATWTLVRELLDTGNVQFILLDQAHIDALRGYAANVLGVDRATLDRIFPAPHHRVSWDARGVVRHAPNHRSHLHVRITGRPDDA